MKGLGDKKGDKDTSNDKEAVAIEDVDDLNGISILEIGF